jgi:hypothetical protein
MVNKYDILNKKIGLNIVLWILIIFSLVLLNQLNKNYQLNKDISRMRNELNKELDEKIKSRELIIQKLRNDNDLKRLEIDNMYLKLDSISRVKNKIKIKYVDVIIDINNMDSQQIKNYWYEEFN